MRWRREQYLDLMMFSSAPRPMFSELFGPLVGLAEEWRAQGATEDEINMVGFDWDYVPYRGCGGQTFPANPPPQVLEDNDEYAIHRDWMGRRVKLFKKAASIALPLDYPVANMDDWLKLKPAFAFREDRINWADVEAARQAQQEGTMIVASIPGAYSMPRELMGDEAVSLAYYDQPELLADMLATFSDTAWRVLDPISSKITIDQLSVHEDFAGRSGPLAGPRQIQEFFKPYYRRIWDMLASRGCRLFQQDTDGNVNAVVDDLLDAGLTSIYPMEPAAGMDVVQLRRKHGRRLAMLGGIDKHVLRRDKPAIRAELEYKMQPLMCEGGMVFGLDHRIPNGTPLENYRYYIDLGREILGLEPRKPENKGWGRMAF